MTAAALFPGSRWPLAPVGSMVQLENGFPFDSDSFSDSASIPLVRIRDLLADSFETYVPPPAPKRVMLADGDVVVGMDGDFNVVRWTRGPAALNQRLCRLRGRPDSDVRFVEYALPISLKYLNSTQFATTVKHLSSREILKSRIPFPPLEEQRRIADFLDDQTTRINNIITARQRQISAIRADIQSTLDQVIEEDIRAFGVHHFRRVIRSIDQGWSPLCNDVPAKFDEYGVLKLSAVRNGEFFPDQNKTMVDDQSPDWRYQIKEGDLLISRANTPDLVGDSAYIPNDHSNLFLCDLLYRVSTHSSEPEYLADALRTSRARALLRVQARGTSRSMAKIRGEDIKDLPVPATPKHLQLERATRLRAHRKNMREHISDLVASVEKFSELKQSLISAAVSGNLNASTANNPPVSGDQAH